jgi:hypothetical protein
MNRWHRLSPFRLSRSRDVDWLSAVAGAELPISIKHRKCAVRQMRLDRPRRFQRICSNGGNWRDCSGGDNKICRSVIVRRSEYLLIPSEIPYRSKSHRESIKSLAFLVNLIYMYPIHFSAIPFPSGQAERQIDRARYGIARLQLPTM